MSTSARKGARRGKKVPKKAKAGGAASSAEEAPSTHTDTECPEHTAPLPDAIPLAEALMRACRRAPPLGRPPLILLSGGAGGADSLFDEVVREAMPAARRIHWSFQEHKGYHADPECRIILSDAFAERIARPRLQVARVGLQNSLPRASSRAMQYFQRNVFQVLWADAVYVAGWLDPAAKSAHRVGGGTRWAVQPYLDRFTVGGEDPHNARLYLYNIPLGEPSGHWLAWDPAAQDWTNIGAPPSPLDLPHGSVIAGIGTQTIPDHARAAIRSIFRLDPAL
eukprot:TRINITY_DN16517_c0_g1_i1.p1 TRINITY_DN16517_c0_g1~~TRINITY_DN16517_c0_g1_i1.p1  ORF type:complete len:280 (+),score=60.64 TRINITY_DN16517_c0_g1_i1:114-953(+)